MRRQEAEKGSCGVRAIHAIIVHCHWQVDCQQLKLFDVILSPLQNPQIKSLSLLLPLAVVLQEKLRSPSPCCSLRDPPVLLYHLLGGPWIATPIQTHF